MDLSLVPIAELAEELMKRSNCGIIHLHGTGPEQVSYVQWVGDYYTALGLCVEMQNHIINDTDTEEET